MSVALASDPVKPPIGYYGAKMTLAPWIISLMPRHHNYVEVFGGSGAVLLAKTRSSNEIYNDAAAALVNLFVQIQADPDAVLRRLEWLPYSRALRDQWRKADPPDDPVEWAARFFYLAWSSIPGHTQSGFSASVRVNSAARYELMKLRLASVRDRLRGVVVECLDWRRAIEKYDRPDTLFYCDPPYVGEETNFPGHFLRGDHLALAELLHAAKGAALVSYAEHPVVRELYAGWHVRERSIRSRLADSRGQPSKQRVELLFSNRPFSTIGLPGMGV